MTVPVSPMSHRDAFHLVPGSARRAECRRVHGRRKEGWLPTGNLTETEIRDWCIAYVKRTVGDPSIAAGPDITFPQMGLDSASSAYFVVELEECLGIELHPEIVVEHPTIAQLAHHTPRRHPQAR